MTKPVPYREALERAVASIMADMRKDQAVLMAEVRGEMAALKCLRMEIENERLREKSAPARKHRAASSPGGRQA